MQPDGLVHYVVQAAQPTLHATVPSGWELAVQLDQAECRPFAAAERPRCLCWPTNNCGDCLSRVQEVAAQPDSSPDFEENDLPKRQAGGVQQPSTKRGRLQLRLPQPPQQQRRQQEQQGALVAPFAQVRGLYESEWARQCVSEAILRPAVRVCRAEVLPAWGVTPWWCLQGGCEHAMPTPDAARVFRIPTAACRRAAHQAGDHKRRTT